jgi:hypothetical protein
VIVAHADWGVDPRKQWVAVAKQDGQGLWSASAPLPAKQVGSLRDRLRVDRSADTAVLGFDFPIGIPRAYATAAEVTSFVALLSECGEGVWCDFFKVADAPGEISLQRPFYPRTFLPKGAKRQVHLTHALGLQFGALRRRCEERRPGRRAACPLFWICGPNQVGKGALEGWRLFKEEASSDTRYWPFDGPLGELTDRPGTVVMETYPAEMYDHLGMEAVIGKGNQTERRRCGETLLATAQVLDVRLEGKLENDIREGFSADDDAFDAVVGLFGMLNVLVGRRSEGTPEDRSVKEVEGWMLGQLTPQAAPAS